jgi:hypothetical protein
MGTRDHQVHTAVLDGRDDGEYLMIKGFGSAA